MLKKLLFTILFATVLFGLGVFNQSRVLAQDLQEGDLRSGEFMFNMGDVIVHKDIDEQGWIRKGVNFVFERVITIMAATVGAAAVLMMAIGGFLMLSSAGRQEQYDKGKNLISKAVIGLVFVLGAYVLVTTVQLLIKSLSQAL